MVTQQVKKRTQVTETADSLLILTSTFSQFVLRTSVSMLKTGSSKKKLH